MTLRFGVGLPVLLIFAGLVAANPGPTLPKRPGVADLLPFLSAGSPDALAGAVRGSLVRALPNPLYEAWPGWGDTDDVPRLRFRGGKPKIVKVPRNDGKWRHIRVTALSPADTLIFDIRDVHHPEPGRITFVAFLSFDARIEFEQQNWQNGIRLLSSGARARFRVKAVAWCEFTWRVETGDLLLPDTVVRLRVVRADVGYDNFVTEHIAGMGGEAAAMIGDALRSGLNRWHPGLERELLARASAAIEKAGDTREVRLSLSEMLKKRGWLPR